MASHELPEAAVKLMVDLSTGHITKHDDELVRLVATAAGSAIRDVPRMSTHEYGYIVFVTSDPDTRKVYLAGMKDAGFSEAFVDIYDRASSSEGIIMLINFDRDAVVIDELPSFEW